MKAENRAVLLLALEQIKTKVKPTQSKPIGTSVPKRRGYGEAFVTNDGKGEWVRFKRECVLLKGGKSK